MDIDISDSSQKIGVCIFAFREKFMGKPKFFLCNGVQLYLPVDSSTIIFLKANQSGFSQIVSVVEKINH